MKDRHEQSQWVNSLRRLLGQSHWRWIRKTHWEQPADIRGKMYVFRPGYWSRVIQVERNVVHAQAKGCVGLVMVGWTAIFILPGSRKKDGNLFRFRIGVNPNTRSTNP